MAAAPEPPETPPGGLDVDLEVNNDGVRLRFRCTTGAMVILGVTGVTIGAIFGKEHIKPIVESLFNSVFGFCKLTTGSLVIDVDCFTVTRVKELLDAYRCGGLKRKFLEELQKIGGTVENLEIKFAVTETLQLNKDREQRILSQGEVKEIDEGRKSMSKDEGRKSMLKDEGRKSMLKDEGRKSMSKDEGKKSISKDEGKRSMLKDDGKESMSKDEGKKGMSNQEFLETLKDIRKLDGAKDKIISDLKHGNTDSDLRDEYGRTYLHYAAQSSNRDLRMYMLRTCDPSIVDVQDYDGRTVLHLICLPGNEEIKREQIFMLLGNGASTNVKDSENRTPRHYAAMNNEHLVPYLISHEANVLPVDYYGKTPLDYAFEHGNVRAIEDLIEQFEIHEADEKSLIMKNMNVVDKEGRNILHHAAKTANEAVITKLVDSGVNVNAVDNNGMSALDHALACIKLGNAVVLFSIMLEKKSPDNLALAFLENLERKDHAGRKPLHYSVIHSKQNVLDVLLERNVTLNDVDSSGMSALHFAAERGNVVAFEKLVRKGANIDGKNDNGCTVLHLAAINGDERLVDLLIKENLNVNEIDNKGRSALHYSIEGGNMVTFMKLLEAGASVKGKNDEGQTVLHLAVERNDEKMIDELIKKNADVNEIDNGGRSALHYSIERWNMVAAMKLLEAGASVNSKNDEGQTVLHLAVQRDDKKMVDELIKKNADVNEIDNKGRSALHYSIERGNVVAAMKLLEAGASVKGKNDEGQTVLHLAVKHGGKELIPLLLKNDEVYEFLNDLDCKGKSVLHYALEKALETGDPNIAFQLVKAGAKAPLVKDWQGNTLLHNAVRENKLNFLNILLQCNLDLNDYDNEGKAALHYAVDSGNKVATEMLLQAGADVNVREITNKFTPLHLAVMRRSDDITQLLLKYNANPKLEDYIGRTAMKYARNPDIIKKMEQAITGFSPEGSEDEVPRKRPKYS